MTLNSYVLGIMATSRESVSIETLFSHELALHPTALFDEDGDMRTTSKAALKNKIQILRSVRNQQPPTVVVLDGCAVLWTVPWPAVPAKVSAFIAAAVDAILQRIQSALVSHVAFDRYYKLSTKSCCRTVRHKGISRVYNLTEDSPLSQQSVMLKVTPNKERLIRMIVDRLCSMELLQQQMLSSLGHTHTLYIWGLDSMKPRLYIMKKLMCSWCFMSSMNHH